MIKLKHIALSLLLFLIATACYQKVIYTKYETLPEHEWSSKNKLKFELDIDENQKDQFCDVYIAVRHTDYYGYNNLFLFLTTEYPNGQQKTDTIECVLANEKGEWKGDGAGDIWDNKIPLKKKVKFPLAGKYKFTYEQAMRVDPLPSIMDMGLIIEKSETN